MYSCALACLAFAALFVGLCDFVVPFWTQGTTQEIYGHTGPSMAADCIGETVLSIRIVIFLA